MYPLKKLNGREQKKGTDFSTVNLLGIYHMAGCIDYRRS